MRTSRIATALVLVAALATATPAAALAQGEAPVTTTTSSAPVLVVRSFATDPGEVLLGQRFTLTLTIRNETKPTAKDVVVSLGATAAGTSSESGSNNAASSGADLVSLDASDVRFVGNLGGGKSTSVTFSLISSPRASAGVFSLPVNISSEVAGTRVTSSQNIGLVIGRVATFSEQNVEMPSQVVVGEQFPISLDVVNTASYAIPGVVLSLLGDGFEFTESSLLVGTVESGDSGTLEVQATAQKSGDATITVVAAYRDDFGTLREVRFPHRVRVEAEPKPSSDVKEGEGAADEEPRGFVGAILSFFSGLFGLGG